MVEMLGRVAGIGFKVCIWLLLWESLLQTSDIIIQMLKANMNINVKCKRKRLFDKQMFDLKCSYPPMMGKLPVHKG